MSKSNSSALRVPQAQEALINVGGRSRSLWLSALLVRVEALLTRERIQFYAFLLCVAYVVILIRSVIFPVGGNLSTGDFLAFWSAGSLALGGEAAAAYDWERLRAVQVQVLGREFDGLLGWLNPPSFFLMVAPLALLAYPVAWAAWVGLSAAFLAAGLCAVLPQRAVLLAGLATPAALFCAGVGQNGFLTAGLFALGLGLLERRPWAAGACLGLLTYKPQFGLLLPLLLAADGRWRSILAAAAAALALAGAAALAFGWEPWAAFLGAAAGNSSRMLGAAEAVSPKLQTVYAFAARALGTEAPALALHGVAALAAAAAALWVWRRPGASFEAKAAAALAGCFLATPYAYSYDMVALAVAAAFLTRAGLREGFLRWEKLGICLACALPLATMFVKLSLVGPAAWALMMALALRRAQRQLIAESGLSPALAGTGNSPSTASSVA